jgi:hypothetical protein
MAAPAIAWASRFPGFDELVLGLLVRLEGQGQSVRCHARSMPSTKETPALVALGGGGVRSGQIVVLS